MGEKTPIDQINKLALLVLCIAGSNLFIEGILRLTKTTTDLGLKIFCQVSKSKQAFDLLLFFEVF